MPGRNTHAPAVADQLGAGFFGFFGFALTGLRATGLMSAGASAISPGSGPGRKNWLRLPRDHAGGDALDIRNVFTAEPHGVRGAGLLLFRGIGKGRGRNGGCKKRNGERESELKTAPANGVHESPRSEKPREESG
jgi:hypothetical protein